MKMHAADSRRMSIQRKDTLASIGIPHLNSAICWATNDCAAWHLRWPHASGVSNQCPQALVTKQHTQTSDNAQYNATCLLHVPQHL